MFDIGMSEIVVIAVVALVAIGPKDLPRALRTAGRWVGKARVLAGEFQRHLDDMVRESEIEEVKRKVAEYGRTDVDAAIANAVDPTRSIPRGLELPEDLHEFDSIAKAVPPLPTIEPAPALPDPALPDPALSETNPPPENSP
ncbi:MAG: twin-arginine translocase subunit TatB [Alphaproteobacteria bacterium]|nr:twin-arginine translocase subunit TatB [Alphaproteobacteria bacterium]